MKKLLLLLTAVALASCSTNAMMEDTETGSSSQRPFEGFSFARQHAMESLLEFPVIPPNGIVKIKSQKEYFAFFSILEGIAQNHITPTHEEQRYFKWAKEIKALSCPNLGVTELPKEVELLTNLTLLDLRDNRIKELPGEIGNLSDLESLYVRGNPLERLPEEICKLKKVKVDICPGSGILDPGSFLHIMELTRLDIDINYNKFTKIPPKNGKLANLKWLNLQPRSEPVVRTWINVKSTHNGVAGEKPAPSSGSVRTTTPDDDIYRM
ncbi:leucine-rich repeat domain-containing protein [bacterium]|jgi:hypothetical protein|nr:leucine-rich repeat domain-containing protein [bacterium]